MKGVVRGIHLATVADRFQVLGTGLRSGAQVTMTIKPRQESPFAERSIVFKHGVHEWPARPAWASVDRCTMVGGVAVVEHLMAAFAMVGITSALVELVGQPEVPWMDGSALPFVEALAPRVQKYGEVDLYMDSIADRVLVGSFPEPFLTVGHKPNGESSHLYEWRYPDGTKQAWACGAQDSHELAPARSPIEVSEIHQFQRQGKYGILDPAANCIGLRNGKPVYPERMAGEAMCHKLLDLVGDIYLSGVPPRILELTASGTGHKQNLQAASQIWSTLGCRVGEVRYGK